MKVLRLFRSCNSTHIRVCVCVSCGFPLDLTPLFFIPENSANRIENRKKDEIDYLLLLKGERDGTNSVTVPLLGRTFDPFDWQLKSITGVVQHAIHLDVTRLLLFF